jgi:tRNA1(Val) A37 N6-methylase TrmN6
VAAPRPPARLLDLGCGIGSVLLFLAWRFPEARCLGIEAQPVSAALARRSVAWNGVEHRCQVVDGDFREVVGKVVGERFDLITGTPPYFPRGTGVESGAIQRAPCRFEHRGGIEAYCQAAAPLLAPSAPLVACAPAMQAARVEAAARGAGLHLARWRDVVPRAGKPPLFSVFALLGTPTHPQIDPPLVVRDRAGQRTPEFMRLRAEMGMP